MLVALPEAVWLGEAVGMGVAVQKLVEVALCVLADMLRLEEGEGRLVMVGEEAAGGSAQHSQ